MTKKTLKKTNTQTRKHIDTTNNSKATWDDKEHDPHQKPEHYN